MPKATNEPAEDANAPEESDAPEAAEENEAKAPKSLVSRLLPILAILLIPAGVGGFIAYSQYTSIAEAAVSSGLTLGLVDDEEADSMITYGQFMTLDELLVNPKDSEGKRFLVVSLGLETKSPAVAGEIAQKDVVVRDAILQLLSEHTAADLAAIEQRDTLKLEILGKLNNILQEGDIERLYFTQYLLQ